MEGKRTSNVVDHNCPFLTSRQAEVIGATSFGIDGGKPSDSVKEREVCAR